MCSTTLKNTASLMARLVLVFEKATYGVKISNYFLTKVITFAEAKADFVDLPRDPFQVRFRYIDFA